MAASVGVANSSNMYRVGDYVFFENSASGPYAVRRIEELNKTASGGFEKFIITFCIATFLNLH